MAYAANLPRRARHAAPVMLLFGLLAALPVGAWAQAPQRDSVSTSATLPQSNDALILTGRVEDALQRGDFRVAMEIIEQIRALPGGLVPATASRTYHPVSRLPSLLLSHFPPAGVQFYRQLYDGEAAARFEDAATKGDLVALRQLHEQQRLATIWPRASRELAAQLTDRGQWSAALEVLSDPAFADDPLAGAQRLIAWAGLRDFVAARAALQQLERHPLTANDAAWRERLPRLRSWIDERERDAGRRPPLAPQLHAPIAWEQPVSPSGARDGWIDESVQEAMQRLRGLPLHQPIVSDGVLVVRIGGVLSAFDADTLAPLWRQSQTSGRPQRAIRGSPVDLEADARAAERLLNAVAVHRLSAGFGLVFSLEGDWHPGVQSMRTFGASAADRAAPNELTAWNLHDGRAAWRLGGESGAPLGSVSFQDVPLVSDGRLLVPFVRTEELWLAVIEPKSGEVLAETQIVGPPTRFTGSGGRCLLAQDESRVYVCTGNGVIAALGRADLQWRWATTYASSLSDHVSRFWWQQETSVEESTFDMPVFLGDLLIVAPIDTNEIIAIERQSGRQRWRRPRGDLPFPIGGSEAGLVLAGAGLSCIDAADGTTLRWKSVPLDLTGRGIVSGSRVFAPTRSGLAELDARTGRLLNLESLAPDGAAPTDRGVLAANLVAAADALLAVTPTRVVKYPDPGLARARLEKSEPGDARSALTLAWIEAIGGRLEEAAALLRDLRVDDSSLAQSRDRLQVLVFHRLAEAAPPGEARLAWLKQATILATERGDAARLAAALGRALEEAGQLEAAADHYSGMLLESGERYQAPADDGAVVQAGWLLAAERLRGVLSGLGPQRSAELLNRLMAAAQRGDESGGLLRRVRTVVTGGAQRSAIDRMLVQKRLPPEIAQAFLPAVEEAEPAERAALRLRRWEVFVSLGMRGAAQAEQAAWRSAAGRSDALDAGEADRDRRELVETLDLATGKLESAVAEPFSERAIRQWRVRDAELLVDPEAPLTDAPPTAWLRRLSDERSALTLYHLVKGLDLRETDVGLLSRGSPSEELVDASMRLLDERDWRGARSEGPPLARLHGYSAIVPVRGGLLHLGMGPERYGGRRIWERAVPEWQAPPANFRDWCAAGAEGVTLVPRADRVQLLDWLDGSLLWQRVLPGVRVERVVRAGERLVLLCAERRVLSLVAESGAGLRELPGTGDAQAVAVAGGRILVVRTASIDAYDPATLERTGSASIGAGPLVRTDDQGRVLLASSADGGWVLLDVEKHRVVGTGLLPDVARITALHVRGDALLVAGLPGDTEDAQEILLARVSLADGRSLWRTRLETRVPVNVSQLAANAALVPVLILRNLPERETPDPQTLALAFVDAESGEARDPIPLAAFFTERSTGGVIALHASPTRVLVQHQQSVTAFGTALVREP